MGVEVLAEEEGLGMLAPRDSQGEEAEAEGREGAQGLEHFRRGQDHKLTGLVFTFGFL